VGARLTAALFAALLLVVATAARAEAPKGLAEALDAVVVDPSLKGARVGAAVLDVKTGEVWYAHGGDQKFNLASNAKVLTTATLLSRTDPEGHYETEVHGRLGDGGVVDGDLVIRGRGDPKLVAEEVGRMADAIKKLGVRKVQGRLVVDDSLFDSTWLPPVYDQKDTDDAYRCAVGALSVDYAALPVTFRPGKQVGDAPRVSVRPDGDDVDWVNTAKTVAGKEEKLSIAAAPSLSGRTKITVTGTIGIAHKGGLVRRRVEDPGMRAGYVFREALERRGVVFANPEVVRGRAPEADPPLYVHHSPTVAELVKDCNQWSNNHMAETFLKHLGVLEAGAPGSAESGVAAVGKVLTAAGIEAGSYTFKNGSGLYDAVFLTPRQLVTFLRHVVMDKRVRGPLIDSLPVAGKTGTLRGRMKGTAAEGRVLAKTGTLDHVITLAGFVNAKSGRLLAFTVLVNDLKEPAARARKMQDRFCDVLARQ
jgi:PBP4 family serine-type D-alanyl-D-alanine carboxypeptidase